jgi:hypothetical protein
MDLEVHKAEAWAAVSGTITNGMEISRHRRAMNAYRASVLIDASTFVKDDHQEGGQKGQRYGPAQIAERLERPQEGPCGLLIAFGDGSFRGWIASGRRRGRWWRFDHDTATLMD